MRHINRLPIPSVLAKKQQEWQQKYDEKRKKETKVRPDSKKYGHPDVRATLECCSHNKCFYCEGKLSGENSEIDHFLEVATHPDKAYDWDNLYLACSNCNDKISDQGIPVTDVLDPCLHSDEEIMAHITFDDECIVSQPNSQTGLKTIQKYRLNTDRLDLKRLRWLKNLYKTIIDIQAQMRVDNRQVATAEEKNTLLRFTQPDQPYSLMCEVYLRKKFGQLFA